MLPLYNEIAQLTKDLIFITETDGQVWAFQSHRAGQQTDEQHLRAAASLPPLITINAEDFDEWFKPRNENETYGAIWEQLYNLMIKETTDRTVFKVLVSQTAYDLYAVGLKEGYLIGFRTNGVGLD